MKNIATSIHGIVFIDLFWVIYNSRNVFFVLSKCSINTLVRADLRHMSNLAIAYIVA